MRKLTTPFLIILIGLNMFLLSCGIFASDPPDSTYIETYENLTSQRIQLVFAGSTATDSFNIPANSDLKSEVGFVHNGDNPIEEFVKDLYLSNVTVRMYSDNKLQKVWSGPAESLGDTINNPFNYDSWRLELYQDAQHEGTIIFSITEDDLN